MRDDARLFGVLGDPIDHSLSPAMHNAAFAAAGLPYLYLRFRVPPDALPGALAAKQVYKQRSATIETINGELKTERGLGRLLVRGLRKVQWSALAYNVVHFGAILLGG